MPTIGYRRGMIAGLPRWFSPTVAALLAATFALSLGAALADGFGALALVPDRVWHGELWRLVTWAFTVPGPEALVATAVVLYWFGGELAARWREPGLRRFVAAIVAVTGVGTLALTAMIPAAHHLPYLGSWALCDALVIAWALEFPDRRLRVYGVLSIGGPVLAYGTAGLTALAAVYFGPVAVLPELLAAITALAWMSASRLAGR